MSKQKTDGQLTGMAGEFLTVGKLFKRGYQASVTLGNAKSVDVFVYNTETNKSFNVQVKTLRKKNCFLIRKESIIPDHIYVFIILNNWDEEEHFSYNAYFYQLRSSKTPANAHEMKYVSALCIGMNWSNLYLL